MRYNNIIRAIFIDRPNRFTAHAEVNGKIETIHVKNTGRCTGVLSPGTEVYLTEPGTPGRKTRYDLVAARKENGSLVNIDSTTVGGARVEHNADAMARHGTVHQRVIVATLKLQNMDFHFVLHSLSKIGFLMVVPQTSSNMAF